MAYLHRIRIKNFRNIEHLDVDLVPPEGKPFRHLILTGPNGAGKTSALELIASRAFVSAVSPTQTSSPDRLAACQLDFDEPLKDVSAKLHSGGLLLTRFRAQRLLEMSPVAGPATIDWSSDVLYSQGSASKLFTQHLVNRKVEQAFFLAEGDSASAANISSWFKVLESYLRLIVDDPGLSIEFNRKSFALYLRYSDGREVTFDQLADGHSAALTIFLELFVRDEARRERFGSSQDAIPAIVILDEVEVHLHLRLQEIILPFLTHIFPSFQFIVATHSPAVIASIPDAIVYDLAKKSSVSSADLQGVRYGTLMMQHFGIASDMDLDSTAKLGALRALARKPMRTADEQRELGELADLLNARSKTLTLEVWKALNPSDLASKGRRP